MTQNQQKYSIPVEEIEFSAIRAQGAGGQNVNKVSSAVHLRFDIRASSLPEYVRERLLGLRDRRITRDGIVVIKAQSHRTQEKNRAEALQRLDDLLEKALFTEKKRTPTKPGRNARKKRTDQKTRRGKVKVLRGKIRSDE